MITSKSIWAYSQLRMRTSRVSITIKMLKTKFWRRTSLGNCLANSNPKSFILITKILSKLIKHQPRLMMNIAKIEKSIIFLWMTEKGKLFQHTKTTQFTMEWRDKELIQINKCKETPQQLKTLTLRSAAAVGCRKTCTKKTNRVAWLKKATNLTILT